MKRIVSISLGAAQRDYRFTTTLLGQRVSVQRVGTNGDIRRAAELVRAYDGKVDAIGLGGLTPIFRIGHRRYPHREALSVATARRTPVLDGGLFKDTTDPWVVAQAEQLEPGIIAGRKVLVLNGIGCYALTAALSAQAAAIRCADPVIHSGLRWLPTPRSLRQLERYAASTLPFTALLPYRFLNPVARNSVVRDMRAPQLFAWADVIAGDFAFIRHVAPANLYGKTIITDDPTPAELVDLQERGVAAVLTRGPALSQAHPYVTADILEALAVALIEGSTNLSARELHDVVAATKWRPVLHRFAPAAHVSGVSR